MSSLHLWFYLQKDKEDAQSEKSGGTGEEEEEEDGSEPWTLIGRGLEELEEGAKKIIQGIENLKTGFKNMSKNLEQKQ